MSLSQIYSLSIAFNKSHSHSFLKSLPLKELFGDGAVADHLDIDTLVAELPDDGDVLLPGLLGLLAGGPLVALLGDGGLTGATVSGLLVEGLAHLKGELGGLEGGGGDNLPLVGTGLGDHHDRSGGHSTLAHQVADTHLGEELLILLLRGSLVGACELNHVGDVEGLGASDKLQGLGVP